MTWWFYVIAHPEKHPRRHVPKEIFYVVRGRTNVASYTSAGK